MKRLGIIGVGNMGGAIFRGLLNAGYVKPEQLVVCDMNRANMEELAEEVSPDAVYCATAAEVAEQCDTLLLAVKPLHMEETIRSVAPYLEGKSVISIAAGWTCAMLRDALKDTGATFLRVMPNTPAMAMEGMTALCAEHTLSEADFAFARGIFDAVGRTVVLPEKQFDGVVAVSGSSPAYVYMLIDAMACAAVKEGIRRDVAVEMAAQSVLGSALMVLSTGEHPARLRDAVCSPGGTTIDAVAVLERKGFAAAVMEAMSACAEKSRRMAK